MDQPLIYSETNGVPRFEAEYFFGKYLRSRRLREGCKVLDVGCGDGTVTKMLAELLGDFGCVVGLDASQKMVEFARAHNADERVDFRVGDVGAVEDLQDFFGVFDYVFSNFCLHWVQDQRQLWKNVYSVLKPGGQVFASFLTDTAIYHVLEAQMTDPKWFPYMRGHRDALSPYFRTKNPAMVLKQHLEDAGFCVDVCKTIERVEVYPDEETLKKTVDSVNPFTGKMSEKTREDYLQDYLNIFIKLDYVKSNAKKHQEARTMPYQLMHVVATKP